MISIGSTPDSLATAIKISNTPFWYMLSNLAVNHGLYVHLAMGCSTSDYGIESAYKDEDYQHSLA